MGLTFEPLLIGSSRDYQIQILNPDDSVPTGQFLSTDVLAASVWQGSAEVSLSTPATTWISATNAQIQVSFQNADTAALLPGVYYLQVTATRGTRSAALLADGSTIKLYSGAGTATPSPTYTTADDLRLIAGWIDDITAPDNDTGFGRAQASARSWLDENILRNWRGGDVSLLGAHGMALNAWYSGGARRSPLRNPWLFYLLQTNSLIVTDRTRKTCAYYALSLICESLITRGNHYAALSARYLHRAQALLASYTAEIQLNGMVDQWGNPLPSLFVSFSATNTLFQ